MIIRIMILTILITIIMPVPCLAEAPMDDPALPYRVYLPNIRFTLDSAEPKPPRPWPHDVKAKDVVLHEDDLPEFTLDPSWSGSRGIPDWMKQLGAVDKYAVWYWNDDQTAQPRTVYNITVVFMNPDGASQYMQYIVGQCQFLGGEIITAPVVGDQMIICATDSPVGPGVIHNTTLRCSNIVSGVGVDSLLDTAMEFVRLSFARIERLTE